MKVTVNGGTMSQAEIDEYVRRIRKKHPDRIINELTLTINGKYVDIQYNYDTVPFERIRRITGYLVGTLDRFNDAKKAEESQRIKHEI
ncbi:anaerobic ribonucleoside-triphosphate reductase [uncultured Ruminococcus sp.]|uniref:anaerobic ribonucleoside-triphosphate reductase n=1 Tax=uncultured Ruminococcus sp. TaxID=165186 RepID=UPI0025E596D6|nr:anaerobic ribonucleoside-triphosphate reductase [uncultured Ruminococcus sp.]